MALQSQTVDVPLIAMSQNWPATAGVAGRLLSLNNAIAKRWMAGEFGSKLRVEKRDGFVPFNSTVQGTDGSSSTKTLDGTSMLTNCGRQLLALGNANMFAYSRDGGSWSTPDYVAPTNALNERTVDNVGTVDMTPDSCHSGGLTFTCWNTASGGPTVATYFNILDTVGTVIRETTLVATASLVAKCVTDGSRFWMVIKPTNPASAYIIHTYAFDGTLLGTNTVGITQDADYFEICASSETGSNGFVFFQRSGAGPNFVSRKVTWNGSAIVVGGTVASVGGCSTGRMGLLRSDSGNHKYYLVTVDGAGPYDFYQWEIDDVTLAASSTALAAAQVAAPAEIGGWCEVGFSTICLSFLNTTPTPQLNYTEIWTLTSGTPVLVTTKRSLTIVSRALRLSGKYYIIGYYQSDPSSTALTNNIQQSTFYLIDLDYAQLYQVCGEWNKGIAYADWQRTTSANKWFHLSSVAVWQDGSTHVALSFRARSFTTSTQPISAFRNNTAGGWAIAAGNRAVNTVGLKDYGFGNTLRRAVEFANETLISGPRTSSWISAPSNHGLSLVPEIMSATPSGAAGDLTPSAPYEVVCVLEWTDANGQRVRSIAGPPYAFTTGATGVGTTRATYTVTVVHNDVGKSGLTIAFYRTAYVDGVQSTQHYKVTNDLSPLYNSGTTVIAFDDTMSDATAATNEILYVDKGFIDRYPCPPFTDGCADAQRAYVVGFDGAVWFSGSKTEGDATWFNPAFRLLLNNDVARSVALLDTTLVIFGRNSNIYVVSVNALPGNDGSGSIPIPLPLPLTHGCTGPVAVCGQGVIFPSTQGGLWLLARDLTDVFVGKGIKEFVEENGPVVDMYVDKNQRVCCLLTTGKFAVLDTVTSAWSTYETPNSVDACTVNSGELTIASGETTVIEHQSPGAFTDGDGEAIISTVQVQCQIGGVRNFKRIWNMQFQGEYVGAHELTVNAYFDDNLSVVREVYEFTPSALLPYIYELPPKVEECASVTLEFIDSFPDGASAGFALEMLGFDVGIQTGLDRLAPSSRRKPANI